MPENFSSKTAFVTDSAGKTEKHAGLPKTYGDTKIVILPRDPLCLYAYWEVSSGTIFNLKMQLTENKLFSSGWKLRVHDVTDLSQENMRSSRYFEISINFDASNRYINVDQQDRSWCVELGLFTQNGEFVSVASSNVVKMPPAGISPVTDEKWEILQKDFERVLKLSGLDSAGKTSLDIVNLMRERWKEMVSISNYRHVGISSSTVSRKYV